MIVPKLLLFYTDRSRIGYVLGKKKQQPLVIEGLLWAGSGRWPWLRRGITWL
jgi:hypothetical protein